MPERTTTSFTVLGLLALRPMSAYELTQQFKRSVGIASQRGESAIYGEPKRLAADGLVTAHEEQRGRRSVAVYDITEAGRAELRGWLAEPSAFPAMDADAVVKAIFSDQGEPADLVAQLEALSRGARARRRALAAQAREYVDGRGPYPDRVDLVALTGRFALDLFEFLDGWATWALDAVQDWPADRPARQAWALGELRDFVATVAAEE